jgi:GNAT superfamily N-acetyltransferase
MRVERLDFTDVDTMLGCHQVDLAAHDTDVPEHPSMSARAFSAWMRLGWNGEPREIWVARAPDDAVTGWSRLLLPDKENRGRADLELVVHPAHRRQGTGQALLQHAIERATANGRSTLIGRAAAEAPGDAFARAAGATATMTDVKRVHDLKALPPLAGLRATADRAAAGYRLISWTGIVPEEHLSGVAAVFNAMGDAPRSARSQSTQWDAQRVRESFNALTPELGQRGYSIAALAEATPAQHSAGVISAPAEMAAITQVFVDPETPDWGAQGITAVARQHRGHRLGLLVKLAMLDLLAEAEPQLEKISTENAAPNDHMIAVNEALGYRVAGPPFTRWELDLVPAG